jgi:hypothetical protein
MTTLRRIAPLGGSNASRLNFGDAQTARPRFIEANPAHLLVDASYQRLLSKKSLTLIRAICRKWDWRNFKCPVVVETDHGFHVIDGQHTAIAAATHPAIKTIPVMVVRADTVAERAAAFIGQNTNRVEITTIQLFQASVAARDPEAVSVVQVCRAARVEIFLNPHVNPKPRRTMAVKAIRQVIRRRGPKVAAQILSAVADAGITPITVGHILAAEHLIAGKLFESNRLSLQELTATLQRAPLFDTELAARRLAKENKIPVNQALAHIWHQDWFNHSRAIAPVAA